MAAAAKVWRNWAGNQECLPAEVVHPRSVDEVCDVVRRAAERGQTVKAVGSGHSFTDAACTGGVQVVLDRLTALTAVDSKERLLTFEAGVTLSALCDVAAAHGMALENMGDVSYQTLAGATSTGTHGTGIALKGLSAQLESVQLVAGDGTVVTAGIGGDAALLPAARIGIGALGVVVGATVRLAEAFDLHAVEEPMRLDAVLEAIDEHVEGNDHFEMYWVPHTGWALTKRNNRTTAGRSPRSRWKEAYDDLFLSNVAFGALCRIGRRRPDLVPKLAKALPSSGRIEYVDRSDRVFTSPRWVHFTEMEYSVPREACADVLNELRGFVDRSGLRISFPVEVRFTASDDMWLSTSYGRQSCYIAVHMYKGTPFDTYFRGVEAIMRAHDGRPHWGKMHYRTADDLRPAYERFDDFLAVRDRLDPSGVFRNTYLDRVLGPPGDG